MFILLITEHILFNFEENTKVILVCFWKKKFLDKDFVKEHVVNEIKPK